MLNMSKIVENKAINRLKLKATLALNERTTQSMCDLLNISDTSWYHKLAGKVGFNEREIAILLDEFGNEILHD